MKYGLVIPTLGERLVDLQKCIRSADQGVPLSVVIVGPLDKIPPFPEVIGSLKVSVVSDAECNGAASAIHLGLSSLAGECDVVTWLGDDDVFEDGSLIRVFDCFRDPNVDFVFGSCRYIDDTGATIRIQKPGVFVRFRLAYWWSPIPQPGSWFRSIAYITAGGLDPKLMYAFDQDLWHRFMQTKRFKQLSEILASYAWHPGSLSFENSAKASEEAAGVRMRYLPRLVRIPLGVVYSAHIRGGIFLRRILVR